MRFSQRPPLRALCFALVLAAGPTLFSVEAQDFPGIARGFEPEKAYQIGEIEQVNLFSGGLTLTLPMGGSYPIGPNFNLGLSLVYNSHLWSYFDNGSYLQAKPLDGFNAGFGWNLSLGRLIHPDDTTNESLPRTWLYYDASGSRHDFYQTLHAGDTENNNLILYSRDGSYLRLVVGAGSPATSATVQFPDGSEHVFSLYQPVPATSYPDYRVVTMRDAFLNAVTVTYPTTASTYTWRLASTATFQTMDLVFDTTVAQAGYYATKGGVLRFVHLKATNNRTATYELSYELAQVTPGNGCATQQGVPVRLPFLVKVALPHGATWEMPWSTNPYNLTDSGCGGNALGLIEKLTLPTKGRMEWSWTSFTFPNEVGGQCRSALYNQAALAQRRHYTRNGGNPAGGTPTTWSYSQALNKLPTCDTTIPPDPPQYSIVTVTNPLGDKTEHYFGVDTKLSRTPYEAYGYPGDLYSPSGPSTSNRIYDGTVSAGNLRRTTQVRYEWDGGATGPDTGVRANQRLAFTNTLYNDDGGKSASATYSDFDGFGHYRRTTLGGSFGAGDVREEQVIYNPGYNSFPHASTGAGGGWTWPSASKWLLSTFTEKKVCEGALFNGTQTGCQSGGQFAREQFCFNATTGFLNRHRRLAGASTAGNDVLAVFSPIDGFVASEAYHGGDGSGGVGLGDNVCTVSTGAQDYLINHTYQFRVRQSSQYAGVNFKSLDLTIDQWTGLPTVDRDSAGLATGLEYDLRGRLIWSKPAAGHGAWTEITYNEAQYDTVPEPDIDTRASVGIKRRDNGSQSAPVLADSSIVFDDLGRVYREFVVLADGTSGRRQTIYNAIGWKDRVSEQATPNEGVINTLYQNYDPFGRPRLITPPDGSAHNIQISYAGDRVVTRTVPIGTSRNTSGVIVEEAVPTTEIYDRQGRLSQVQEPSGATGNTTTLYKYDEDGRLIEASTNGQVRTFNYDGRGFLTSEVHPEKGATGHGTVSYLDYDARGHAKRKVDGPFDLTYTFDGAERVLSIRETSGGQRLLKEWTYDSTVLGGTWAKGKPVVAVRHNWVEIPSAPGTFADVIVTEQMTYAGRDGRVSARSTSTNVGGNHWSQSWVYNALGQVTSMSYPLCSHTNCATSPGTAPPRTVAMTYTNGWLTGITGFGTLSYHSNGLVNQILHSNGVTDTQDNDPFRMRRPLNIRTTFNNFVMGPYEYDGAGNITDIGANKFLYDKVSRIKSYTFSSGEFQTYTYDVFGNLTAKSTTRPPAAPLNQSFTVLGLTNRLSGVGYDSAGNQTSWGAFTYTYDAFGMMVRMQGSGNENTFIYTADDERLWTADYDLANPANNVDTFRLRDLDAKVLREYRLVGGDAVGNWMFGKDYIYRDAGRLLASVAPGNVISHFTLDHLGTPRLVTNNSGGYVSDHHYFAYGEELNPQTTEALKFTGHERDFNQGGGIGTSDDLDYMHARYHSPVTGRFLSVDRAPGLAKRPQSWNRYTYASGNPLNRIDPDGLADFYVMYTFSSRDLPDQTAANFLRSEAAFLDARDGQATKENFQKTLSDDDGVSIYLGHSNNKDSLLFNNVGPVPFSDFAAKNDVICIAACNSSELIDRVQPAKGQAFVGVSSSNTDGSVTAADLAFIASELVQGLKKGESVGKIVESLNKIFADRAKNQGGYEVKLKIKGDRNVRVN